MKILICEDELIIAEYLKEICLEAGHQVLGVASSKAAAMIAMELQRPTLVLMDINLEGEWEGIRLAKTLRSDYDTPCIFITAYDDLETINRAVEAQPLAYLVKPVDRGTLTANLRIAYAKLMANKQPTQPLVVSMGKEQVTIELDKLLYVEAFANYMELHFHDGLKTILRTTLSHLSTQLPEQFIRIHKSYIVNRQYLTRITHVRAMVSDKVLPVGRAYYQNL